MDVECQANTVGLDESVLSIWVRVRVANPNGRRVARSCKGHLLGITRVGIAECSSVGLPNSSRALNWEHLPGQSARDIHSGDDHRLDILHAASNEACLRLSVSPPFAIPAAGIYELLIRVTSENADAKTITIRIQCDGNWHSLRAADDCVRVES